MVGLQVKQMTQFFSSTTERVSKANLELAMTRDIAERLTLVASEPESVSYAELDADGAHRNADISESLFGIPPFSCGQTCTAVMSRDFISVVDAALKIYRIDWL
jgi:hypothetical protein